MAKPTYELVSVEYQAETQQRASGYLYKVTCSCREEHIQRLPKGDLSDGQIAIAFDDRFHPRAGHDTPRTLAR